MLRLGSDPIPSVAGAWAELGNTPACFEYRTASERSTVTEIWAKLFGIQNSKNYSLKQIKVTITENKIIHDI